MALPADHRIYPIMLELKGCLCDQIGTDACFCGISVSGDIPLDLNGCDNCVAGYVRLDTAFPSTNSFPQPDETARCGAVWAFSLSVGIARCIPVFGDDQGGDPSAEDLEESAAQILADMSAIIRAIDCCFTKKFEDATYVISSYTPLPPQGGIGGGEVSLIVQELF